MDRYKCRLDMAGPEVWFKATKSEAKSRSQPETQISQPQATQGEGQECHQGKGHRWKTGRCTELSGHSQSHAALWWHQFCSRSYHSGRCNMFNKCQCLWDGIADTGTESGIGECPEKSLSEYGDDADRCQGVDRKPSRTLRGPSRPTSVPQQEPSAKHRDSCKM